MTSSYFTVSSTARLYDGERSTYSNCIYQKEEAIKHVSYRTKGGGTGLVVWSHCEYAVHTTCSRFIFHHTPYIKSCIYYRVHTVQPVDGTGINQIQHSQNKNASNSNKHSYVSSSTAKYDHLFAVAYGYIIRLRIDGHQKHHPSSIIQQYSITVRLATHLWWTKSASCHSVSNYWTAWNIWPEHAITVTFYWHLIGRWRLLSSFQSSPG